MNLLVKSRQTRLWVSRLRYTIKPRMNFCDFKWLDLPLQAHIVCREGVYMGERNVDDLFVALYRVYDFYVEVYYRCKDSMIIKFISFHGDVLLEPYLQKIAIDGIFCDVQIAVR